MYLPDEEIQRFYAVCINAKEELLEDYPQAQIYVMDSQVVTAIQGLFVQEAVRIRNMGASLKEAVEDLGKDPKIRAISFLRQKT